MKLAIEMQSILDWERARFRAIQHGGLHMRIPRRRMLAYLRIKERLATDSCSAFENCMFDYACGVGDPDQIAEAYGVEHVFGEWLRECTDIANQKFEDLMFGRRSRGFLEGCNAEETLLWFENWLRGCSRHCFEARGTKAARTYSSEVEGAAVEILARWENRDAPLVLWSEILLPRSKRLTYAPIHLSLDCWRMQWDECGSLTEGDASDVLGRL